MATCAACEQNPLAGSLGRASPAAPWRRCRLWLSKGWRQCSAAICSSASCRRSLLCCHRGDVPGCLPTHRLHQGQAHAHSLQEHRHISGCSATVTPSLCHRCRARWHLGAPGRSSQAPHCARSAAMSSAAASACPCSARCSAWRDSAAVTSLPHTADSSCSRKTKGMGSGWAVLAAGIKLGPLCISDQCPPPTAQQSDGQHAKPVASPLIHAGPGAVRAGPAACGA